MNKRIVTIIAVSIAVAALIGVFLIYPFTQSKNELRDESNQNIEEKNNDSSKPGNTTNQTPNIEVVGEVGGGLIICVDKCGDGICQAAAQKCDNLNCTCQEDKQECPSDCK